jgi:hypothetical protein
MTFTRIPLIAQQTRAKPIRDGSASSATIDMSMKAAIRKKIRPAFVSTRTRGGQPRQLASGPL